MPPGYYSAADLATQLTADITAATAGSDYTVEYSAQTGGFTVTSVGETFTIDFTVANNMAAMMGFVEAATPVGLTAVSSAAANITMDCELFVCSNLISGVDNGVLVWSGNDPASEPMGVLAVIPINTCFGGFVRYYAPAHFPFYKITNSAFANPDREDPRDLQMSIKFPSGAAFSLNGNDWTAQLTFDFNA